MAPESKNAKLTLYSYWRSSCGQRVQIALKLKGVDYEYRAVDLSKREQLNPGNMQLNTWAVELSQDLCRFEEIQRPTCFTAYYSTAEDLTSKYEKINPIKFVPALIDGDVVASDSFAIILYLEDKYPKHPLLPKDIKKRALNIQIASIVGSSIQPVYFIPAISFVEGRFNSHEKLLWAQHHINKGFTALEKLLKESAGKYATGDEIQMADVFLEPQIHTSMKRFQIDMSKFPTLARLHDAYMEHPAFQAAVPESQPDAPKAT